jgi:hypothetical protein
MKTLTNSQRKAFFKCPRKWHFENILCRRPITDNAALLFGTAFHKFLENWWIEIGQSADNIPALENKFENAKLRAMCRAYHEHWNTAAKGFSEVKTEVKFEVPIFANKRNSAWSYSGKIDGICEDSEGLWLVEHKTTSSDITEGSEYWSRLEIDGQIEGYMLGFIKSEGIVPNGVIYDVAKKPGIKPLRQDKDNSETPEEYEIRCYETIIKELEKYMVRKKIYKTADKISEFEATLYHSGRMIDYAVNENFFPGNADGCKGFGTCPYFDVCAGNADIMDNYRFLDTTPNPELQEAS